MVVHQESQHMKPYADMLISTIEHLFPKATLQVQRKVFAVSFRILAEGDPSMSSKAAIRAYVHLAIVADSNYVKVCATQTDGLKAFKDLQDWHLVCDHDSAWRDDGVRSVLTKAHRDIVRRAAERFECAERSVQTSVMVEKMAILPREDVFGATLPAGVLETFPY
jgi:hypothetical protein